MGIFDFLFESTVEEEAGAVNDNQQSAPVVPSNPGLNSPSDDSDAEKFVLKFREAIVNAGGIGAKFIKLLYELSKNPGPADYQKAFSISKIMDPSLSIESILGSLSECETMISDEKSKYLKQGNDKKSRLEIQRDTEKEQLTSKVSSIKSSIQSLETELSQKKAELKESSEELSKVDQKYQPELTEVTRTINAVSVASDRVLSSIAQLKDEITNNLK